MWFRIVYYTSFMAIVQKKLAQKAHPRIRPTRMRGYPTCSIVKSLFRLSLDQQHWYSDHTFPIQRTRTPQWGSY
jgi:hypothetical protein